MQKIYLDTNIYLDYFENRSNGLRPLGDFAFGVIRRATECEFMIIISDLNLQELLKNIEKERLDELLASLKRKLIKIGRSDEDVRKAKGKVTHFTDALHGILAIKAKVDYFITRNINDFTEFSKELNIKLPESL